VKIVDKKDGSYVVNYILPETCTESKKELNVMLHGKHIQGSPFTVVVVQRVAFTFDNNRKSTNITLSESNLVATQTTVTKWSTVCGTKICTGKMKWSVKVEKLAQAIIVGVSTGDITNNEKFNGYWNPSVGLFVYNMNGYTYSSSVQSENNVGGKPSYTTGDVITCEMDNNAHTLLFKKNNVDVTTLHSIPDNVYPCVGVYQPGEAWRLV